MALSNGIPNFTKLEMEDRSHERFRRWAERRYNIARNSLFQFEQQMNNMLVVVEILEETKTLCSLWENFNNYNVSVIIPPNDSKEVTFSLAKMAMTKGFEHLHIHFACPDANM